MATSCFPTAIGVPGNPNPPDWLSGTPVPFDGSPDDPRWVGALAHSLGDGAGVQLLFRALVNPAQTQLFLSWLVKVDPSIGDDTLFVGFGTAANALVVKLQLLTATPTPPGSPNAVEGVAYNADSMFFSGGIWTPSGNAPAWVANGTRAWINYGTPNPTPFAIHMLVPVNQFLDLGGNQIKIVPGTSFKMWYSAYVNTPTEPGADVEYVWPGLSGVGLGDPPAPNTWADMRVSTIANDPACDQQGITIDVVDIGTKNLDATSRPAANEIRFDQAGLDATQNNHSNMFFAHPTFPFADVARRGDVRARFRMANWGSQIGTLTSQSWTTIPGGDAVPCDTNQAGGESHFLWPTQPDLTDPTSMAILSNFRNGTTTRDQCILVELSSVHAGGEIFLVNSIRRNMWLAAASTFQREAEISIVGLQPINAVPRDVYLYLETLNMPVKVPQDEPPPPGIANHLDAGAATFATQRRPTIEDLIKFAPTYRVHVYHDTGRKTKLINGQERRILSPQSSFGYFLEHEGALDGWDARLQGAIRISETFYLLRIDNNGTAKVTTVVQGREPGDPVLPQDPIVKEPPPITPPPTKGCGCLGWLFKLFGKNP
ncbi:MAG TPA: hypothetical protein VE961_07940 [Pyrinomonadaceae bacterium]|nr:hypothetical protein [Pyrinomonadaceae bacterium]